MSTARKIPSLSSSHPLTITAHFQQLATPPPPPTDPYTLLLLSMASGGFVGDIRFEDEDILAYNRTTGGWSLVFDGSDVGLGSSDVDAVALTNDGALVLSLNQPATIPALGKVADADLLLFRPSSTGPMTTGSFEWYLDGSDVGLTTAAEDIDAVQLLSSGELLISTAGAVSVRSVQGADEDILRFAPTQLGANTDWQLEFLLRWLRCCA